VTVNEKPLKIGYSTGSHATSALKAALMLLLGIKSNVESVEITLPEGNIAFLDIDKTEKFDDYVKIEVVKGDNDDIDVTKGCRIVCFVGFDSKKIPYTQHEIQHKPYKIDNIFIYAGKGLGVVTKEGLKPPVGYPAINPATLEMMKNNIQFLYINTEVYVFFEVENGEEIAKNTANLKAGVVGGISFLGKKGIVKPISTDAYLESLEVEINVAAKNPSKTIIFTMGNECLEFAKKVYGLDPECYVEIGNFVYDSLSLIKNKGFSKVVISANIGKLTKIAQGKKNTNSRYGGIDFKILQSWLGIYTISDTITTVGALEVHLPHLVGKLYEQVSVHALNVLKKWMNELNIKGTNLEILLKEAIIC